MRQYTSAVIAWAPEDQPSDKEIEAYLVQRVESGLVEDRHGVVAALKEAGFLSRLSLTNKGRTEKARRWHRIPS